VTGTELLRARPEDAPEVYAALGQVMASLGGPGESVDEARQALECHRDAGTDLGPLAEQAMAQATGASGPSGPWVTLDHLHFDGTRLVGLTRDDLRGAPATLWQIRDAALRAIAIEAYGLPLESHALTDQALLLTLQHGSTAPDIECARRDLTELLGHGVTPRLHGFEPLSPRPALELIRQGLLTDNLAAVSTGLLAELMPAVTIAPRLLVLGRRIGTPAFRVAWIQRAAFDHLDGAVGHKHTASVSDHRSGQDELDDFLFAEPQTSQRGPPDVTAAQGIAPAAALLPDLPDDPRLPPLLLALAYRDASGELEASPESILYRIAASLRPGPH
jgi:hypothetical protein